jgi:hypothetical protein
VIGSTEQKKFAGSSYAAQLAVKLPMSHPFGENQGRTADENEDKIQGGWMSDPIDQVRCQKHRSTHLMSRPDENRKVQNPIGPRADSAHSISRTPSWFLPFRHYSTCALV